MTATRRDAVNGRGESALVSCQPLNGLFEEVERRGLAPERLLGDVPHSLDVLRGRRNRVPWDDFRTILDNLTDHYSDHEIIDIGRHLVHTEAQRPFALIARHFFSIGDFYRAVFSQRSGWGSPMFPCMVSSCAQLDEGLFEVTVTLHEGFEPSHAFPLITQGNITGMPEVLGDPPAEVTAEVRGHVARFEVVAPDSSNLLTRLRQRITLPFRARDMAAELQDAHGSLRARYDALQTALEDRERTTVALLESETRLRLMLEGVEMSIWDWDLSTDVVTFDESGQKMLGFVRPDQPLESFLEVVVEEDRAKVTDAARESLATSQLFVQRFRVVRDGDLRTLEARGQVFHDALGEPARFVGVLQDQTDELRRTERQAHLGRVVAGSPYEIYVIDLDGLHFVDVNLVACENLGYSQDELLTMTPQDITDLAEGHSVEETVAPLLSGETDKVIASLRHLRRDGSTYPVELVLHTSTLDSKKVMVGIGVDRTERARAEEQRRELENQLSQAQKLEALGTLAGGITHDFNNLLQAITGFAELAADEIAPDSAAAEHLGHVLRAATSGRGLARQILTFSRTSDEPQEQLQLGPVVREALALVQATLPTTVRLRTELAEDGCVIRGDAGQIGQIVTNLCTNAAHALGERGGPIDVTVKRCELGPDAVDSLVGLEAGAHVCLTITDQGTGMSAQVKDRIFDPFFTTKDESGTGLGLAVVHGIIRAHRGAIDVESEPGAGTTVRVFLPCCDDVVDVAPAAGDGAPRGSGQVLVVDDVDAIAAMLGRGLERFGYHPHVVSESTAALEAFSADPGSYDVVVTDQTMPEMTGVQLAERLRAIRDDVPIVLISGLGAPAAESDLERVGISEVLPKPFDLDELGRVMARVARADAGR